MSFSNINIKFFAVTAKYLSASSIGKDIDAIEMSFHASVIPCSKGLRIQ